MWRIHILYSNPVLFHVSFHDISILACISPKLCALHAVVCRSKWNDRMIESVSSMARGRTSAMALIFCVLHDISVTHPSSPISERTYSSFT